MRTTPVLRLLYVLSLISALSIPSCILSPEEDTQPPDPTENYKPLTDKENVIYNLVQSYKLREIEPYKNLLHNDYIWRNQNEDITNPELLLPEFLSRDQDINSTTNMFAAANGTHPDPSVTITTLELTIQSAVWSQIPEFEGNPCDDCWETTRVYTITVRSSLGNYDGDDLVIFTVIPKIDGDTKIYQLRRADDILGN